jgi:hypothetical protein
VALSPSVLKLDRLTLSSTLSLLLYSSPSSPSSTLPSSCAHIQSRSPLHRLFHVLEERSFTRCNPASVFSFLVFPSPLPPCRGALELGCDLAWRAQLFVFVLRAHLHVPVIGSPSDLESTALHLSSYSCPRLAESPTMKSAASHVVILQASSASSFSFPPFRPCSRCAGVRV